MYSYSSNCTETVKITISCVSIQLWLEVKSWTYLFAPGKLTINSSKFCRVAHTANLLPYSALWLCVEAGSPHCLLILDVHSLLYPKVGSYCMTWPLSKVRLIPYMGNLHPDLGLPIISHPKTLALGWEITCYSVKLHTIIYITIISISITRLAPSNIRQSTRKL